MARYIVRNAVSVGQFRFPAGTTFADTSGNAIAGDIVLTNVPGLASTAASLGAFCVGADAAGAAVLGTPQWSPGQAPFGAGVDSVRA